MAVSRRYRRKCPATTWRRMLVGKRSIRWHSDGEQKKIDGWFTEVAQHQHRAAAKTPLCRDRAAQGLDAFP